jgi:hypothetical protein
MLKVVYKPSVSLLWVIAWFGITTAPAPSAPSPSPTPILVELFTSEGCSDCPPADRFLRTLDSTQPVPGAQLIVLEEHVDYWDDLGWRDPFSSHAFTLRQQDYVDRMRLASAYTPQIVVDGAYQFVGSDLRSAGKAFQGAGSMSKVGVRISTLKIDKGKLLAHIETDALPSKADVLVAVALEHAESRVLRGENGGHHLEHVAIVKDLEKIGKPDKGRAFSKDISLSTKLNQPGRLIVFLQEPNQGRILGAAVQPFQN